MLKEAAPGVNQEAQRCFFGRHPEALRVIALTVAFAIPGVAGAFRGSQNKKMRAFASLLIAALLFGGIYYIYMRRMPTVAEGTAPTQAISLTGVQNDLLQIAQAERSYIVQNTHCTSLDELVSSQTLLMKRSERDGYTYSIECSGMEFTATARHAPAAADSPIRFPTMVIDQTMQVRTD